MNTYKLSNVSLAQFREFLFHVGCCPYQLKEDMKNGKKRAV